MEIFPLKESKLPEMQYTSDLPFMAIPFPDHEVKHSPVKEKQKFRRVRSPIEKDFGIWKRSFQSFKMASNLKVSQKLEV